MKQRHYEVILSGYSTKIRAFNEEEAIILAQAEAIKNARDYRFISIKELDD